MHKPRKFCLFSLLLGLSSTALGCLQAPDWEASTALLDDRSILGTAVHFRDSAAFVQVNGTSYASALGSDVIINVWVSSHAFAPYATIDPDIDSSNIIVPEGTIIVREVLDDAGEVKRLTLMAKGPKGYNPDLGDFWFGVTEPDGTPLVEAGQIRVGKLQDCYSCHLARVNDDYLFGVPSANRNDFGGGPPPSDGTGQPWPQLPPLPPEQSTPPAVPQDPICGDFICQRTESCVTCAYDCGRCNDDDDRPRDDDDDSGGGRDDRRSR